MNTMRIRSGCIANIISRFISMAIRKRFGYELTVELNNVEAVAINEKIRIVLDVSLDEEDLMNIIKHIVL